MSPLRRWLFNLHLVVGMTLGLLAAVIGVSGSLLVFRHEIDRLIAPPALRVSVPRDGAAAPPAPLDRVADAVRVRRPDAPLRHLFVAPGPGDPHEGWLDGTTVRVLVDPYAGTVLGERDADRTPMGILFSLHTTLLAGEAGERVAGWAGLGLLFLCASGLVLWWPANPRQFRERVRVKWTASAKRVNFDLHRTGGFWVCGLVALIALTGTSLAFKDASAAAAARLSGNPEAAKKPVVEPPAPGAVPVPLGELLRRADDALPGGVVRRISFPAKPDAPLIVRKMLPGELHPNGVNYIYLDPYTGAVLRVDRAASALPGQRFLNARFPLHIGLWGGLLTRVLHAAAGLAPAALFATGVLMWWNRVGSKRMRARRAVSRQRESLANRATPGL